MWPCKNLRTPARVNAHAWIAIPQWFNLLYTRRYTTVVKQTQAFVAYPARDGPIIRLGPEFPGHRRALVRRFDSQMSHLEIDTMDMRHHWQPEDASQSYGGVRPDEVRAIYLGLLAR